MANVTLWGASYSGVPACTLPKTGGGTVRFTDTSGTTATVDSVLNGYTFITSAGASATGGVTFVTYYTGSGNPSSSVGSNGDIYLKTVN